MKKKITDIKIYIYLKINYYLFLIRKRFKVFCDISCYSILPIEAEEVCDDYNVVVHVVCCYHCKNKKSCEYTCYEYRNNIKKKNCKWLKRI